jgi:hypothetical protein
MTRHREGKPALERAKREMEKRLRDRRLPGNVVRFLEKGWTRAMALAGEKDPALWNFALLVTDKLLARLTYTAESRQVGDVSRLTVEVARLCEALGLEEGRRDKLLSCLGACRIACLRWKGDRVEAADEEKRDRHMDAAMSLRLGDWLDLREPSQKRFVRVRLERASSISLVYSFSDKSGHKFDDVKLDDLANRFRTGDARLAGMPAGFRLRSVLSDLRGSVKGFLGTRPSNDGKRHASPRLGRGLHLDLDVVPEPAQTIHQLAFGQVGEVAAQQGRYLRLRNAHSAAGFFLREAELARSSGDLDH